MEIEFLDKFPNCPLLSEISFRHFPAAQVAKKKATVTGQQNADFLFHFHLPLIELINTLIAFAISRRGKLNRTKVVATGRYFIVMRSRRKALQNCTLMTNLDTYMRGHTRP